MSRLLDAGQRAAFAVALPMAFLMQSSAASALCPNCLAQTRTLTPTLQVLGVFLLVPFVVAYVVYRAIRRACRDPR